jgi:hypothetical protein
MCECMREDTALRETVAVSVTARTEVAGMRVDNMKGAEVLSLKVPLQLCLLLTPNINGVQKTPETKSLSL